MNLDLKVGDVVLGGKFKNKRIEVESIGTDEIGQPIINGDRKLLAVRIEKTLPEGMWSSKSLADKYKENDMDKNAFLEQTYNSAFKGELEKIAGEVKIPDGGLKPGWLYNDPTQTMTPDDAKKVKENVNFFMRSGPGLLPLAAVGAGYSGLAKLIGAKNKTAIKAGVAGAIALPLISYLATKSGFSDKGALEASRSLVNRANKNETL